jgi:hypothetical protein
MKIESILDYLASALILGGIISAGIYKAEPQIVELTTMLALMGIFLNRGLAFYNSRMQFDLSITESTERSLLFSLRNSIQKDEDISKETLECSFKASIDADNEYKKIYGFYRPAMETRATPQTSNLSNTKG